MTFWVAGAIAGSAVLGSMAAGDAADAQAASADKANALNKQISDDQIALQREQFNKGIELQQPFREGGLAAQNQLLYLLGLSPTGSNASDPRIQDIRARLAPQFTESGSNAPGTSWSVERTNALNDAVNAELQKQQPQGQGGPGFGSLMRDFSMADFQQDPGYQFRQQQGEQGLMRAAAASGRLGSGRYMKDAMKFNSGLADQSYGDAFNRFQINRSNKLNPLQSLMGAGQTSANTMGSYGQNYANSVGNSLGAYGQSTGANILGAGNARAAGSMGAANAIGNGVSQGVSMYQQGQLMNKLFPSAVTYGGSGISGGGGFGTGSAFGNMDYGQFF